MRKRWVTAAILRQGRKVLLTRRAQGQKLAGYWEFPGGKVRPGETPESCLARELEEELSLHCQVGSKVAECEYAYDHGEFVVVAYEAEIRAGHLTLSVHDQARWVDMEDLLTYRLAPADIPIATAVKNRHAISSEERRT